MEFYGLVGETLVHSISPYIHQRIMELSGTDGAYKLMSIPSQELQYLGRALKLLSIRGVNVTIPYKERIMAQLDELSPAARVIGAVNTIDLKNGCLTGYNTDYDGFALLLQYHRLEVAEKTAVILGTGGVSKAVQAALLDSGIKKLYLVTRQKPQGLAQSDPRCAVIDYQQLASLRGDYLINGTPIGMHPKTGASPVGAEVINNFQFLIDMIYNPGETEFLRLGKTAGKSVFNGLYMLIAQAVKAQELWQDKAVDPAVIEIIYWELKKELGHE